MDRRWGVLLTGHEFDLLDWMEGLNAAFDPVVEKREIKQKDEFVLFSREFGDADSQEAVRETALTLIAGINGAMAIRKRAGLVRLSGVVDFSHGEPRIHVSIEAHGALLRIRGSSVAISVYGKGGNLIPPPPPKRSHAQEWLELSRQSDHVADLLTYAARADNWFDIYKLIEAASVLAGGEHQLTNLCDVDVKTAKERANEARHHRVPYEPRLLSLEETKAIAFRAADIVLARAVENERRGAVPV